MKRLIIILLFLPLAALAQPNSACPGFRNPTSFNTGSSQYFWSARVGERVSTNSTTDTTTGYYVMSTCADPNAQAITGHANITSSSHDSGDDEGVTCCSDGSIFDANGHRFQILTQAANGGIDQLTLNNGVGMQRIPPGYTSCIRLGDPRATGNATTSHNWTSGTNRGAEALFYTMKVTSQNALLFVNYAVVGRQYDHSTYQAGEFLIRVVKQNADGTWPNAPINDSLWFKVSAPHFTGALPSPWLQGRPGNTCSATTCGYVYKPWTKVAINLNNYIYSNVRVEMYTSDCIYNWDPIYAYICGDFSPMILRTSGCPDAGSDVLDTLKAPAGMISYQWFVTTQGAEDEENFYDPAHMNNVHFRQVYPATGVTTDSIFTPTLQHFVATEGANRGDTVPEQTFLCIMTSAMDPSKPFSSKLYTNVTNTRPAVNQRTVSDCDGTVHFYNESVTFGSTRVRRHMTYWEIYSDPARTELIATINGDSATYRFPQAGTYYCRLYCHSACPSDDSDSVYCAASGDFTVRTLAPPRVNLSINRHILCDDERLFARVTDPDNPGISPTLMYSVRWTLGDSVIENVDTLLTSLPFGTHPVSVTLTNGDGCSTTVYDTVNVYGAPVVSMGTDATSICVGDTVQLTAEGNARYVWSSTPADPDLDAQQGQSTLVVSPQVTTVYVLEPVPENPCSSEGTSIRVEVIPTPTPLLWHNFNEVKLDYPTVNFTDISNDRASTMWHFSDGTDDEGVSVSHTFVDLGGDSVGITMTTCNRLDCCADTLVKLPVVTEGIWFPNAFTPGLNDSDNNRFRIISTFPLLQFEIYVYNRNGLLVFTSTDPDEGWDGTDMNGHACPQGAYVYYYRYSRLGTDDYFPGAGTVTLIR